MASTEPAFGHGVASGDPLDDRVVLWTRVSGADPDGADVEWVVGVDPALRDVVASGRVRAEADKDFTVKVDVTGLEPASTYWYGFRSGDARSPTGRTRTLPSRPAGHVRFAMVSCAKYNAGYFNAYGRIAERDDLDFVLHLGDYIYEAAQKPPPSQTPAADIGRTVDPPHECVRLEDYRRRYAHYRRDPDVRALHLAHALIATVDDHEFADGAWRDGSVEHRTDRDGDWAQRRATAFRARWEWMPAREPRSDSERVFRTVPVGDLADLMLLDLRTRRDRPVPPPEMHDPGRTMLGREQREWLLAELSRSDATWRLIGNPSVLSQTWSDKLGPEARRAAAEVKLVAASGDGPDFDQWDGYPAERGLVLEHLSANRIRDVVVLSGDVHVSMALEVGQDPLDPDSPPVAVEFVTGSLTSQNVDDKMHWLPRSESLAIEQAMVQALPDVAWCDLDSNGYVVIDVTPERVEAEWWHVDTVLRPSQVETCSQRFRVERGAPRLVPV